MHVSRLPPQEYTAYTWYILYTQTDIFSNFRTSSFRCDKTQLVWMRVCQWICLKGAREWRRDRTFYCTDTYMDILTWEYMSFTWMNTLRVTKFKIFLTLKQARLAMSWTCEISSRSDGGVARLELIPTQTHCMSNLNWMILLISCNQYGSMCVHLVHDTCFLLRYSLRSKMNEKHCGVAWAWASAYVHIRRVSLTQAMHIVH